MELWIIQTRIQHYRLPVFDRLQNNALFRIKLKVFGSLGSGAVIRRDCRNYIVPIKLRKIFGIYYWSNILNKMISSKPEFVILTASPRNISSWIIPIIRKTQKIKTIGWSKINSDNLDKNNNAWSRLIKRMYYSLFDHMVVYGNNSKKELLSLSYAEYRITIAKNTINSSIISEQENALQSNVKYIKDTYRLNNRKVILFIGRMHSEKRPFDLLSAWSDISKGDENISLIFVGSGPLLQNLKSKAKGLNDRRIQVIGRVPQFYDYAWIKVSSCLVLTGQVGLAIQQGMLLGTPVIIADESGVDSELIKHGVTGYRYKKGNSFELSSIVKHVLSLSKEEAGIVRNNAKKSMLNNSIDQMSDSILQAIKTTYNLT